MAIQELDYDFQVFTERQKADQRLYVRFFTEPVPDLERTEADGVKRFREAEMIQIAVPGDKHNVVMREVREGDKERFPRQYEHFVKGKTESADGYPLSQWPMVSRSVVEELKYMNFHTVEQVANASDQACTKMVGLRELQRRAKAFLDLQKDVAPLEKITAQLEAKDAELEVLRQQVAELQAAVKKQEKN